MKYCIGVSGGSGNLVSYLAGQRGRNLRFFTDHIHSPDYFGLKSLLKTGDLFGLKYIYGDLTRAIPVRRALAQGCEKLVVILSKNRDFVIKLKECAGCTDRYAAVILTLWMPWIEDTRCTTKPCTRCFLWSRGGVCLCPQRAAPSGYLLYEGNCRAGTV